MSLKRVCRRIRYKVQKILRTGSWTPPVDYMESKKEEISRNHANKYKRQMLEIYDKYLKDAKFPQVDNVNPPIDVVDELLNPDLSVFDYIMEIYATIERGVPFANDKEKKEVMQIVKDLGITVNQNVFISLIALRDAYRMYMVQYIGNGKEMK